MNLLHSRRGRLMLAGMLLLLAGSLLPWWSTTTAGAATREEQIFSLGLPRAPWLRSVNTKQHNPDGTVTYTTGKTYYPLSISALAAVAGLGLIVVALAQRETSASTPKPAN